MVIFIIEVVVVTYTSLALIKFATWWMTYGYEMLKEELEYAIYRMKEWRRECTAQLRELKGEHRMGYRKIKRGVIYRHFKGGRYLVLDVATHTETYKDCVIYAKLEQNGRLGRRWIRPYSMFASEVDHEKYPNVTQKYRFEEERAE